nr:DUF1254 domain-containing protein [uncultured Gellertiella sp.]
MFKLAYAILTGLVGAALLHVIIILALPHYVTTNAYARVEALGPSGTFYRLPDGGAGPAGAAPGGSGKAAPDGSGSAAPDGSGKGVAGLRNQDPYLEVSVCKVDVTQAPVRLYAEGDVPLWSVVIFDKDSNEVFSMNDRTSVAGALDILLATPARMPAIRKALPEDLAESILVEMPTGGGYAVLRAFSPRSSFRPAAEQFLEDAECSAYDAAT